jgi:hypothetical protein
MIASGARKQNQSMNWDTAPTVSGLYGLRSKEVSTNYANTCVVGPGLATGAKPMDASHAKNQIFATLGDESHFLAFVPFFKFIKHL